MIFVGDDWSEAHHDVYVCDPDGRRLARQRLAEGLDGIADNTISNLSFLLLFGFGTAFMYLHFVILT